MLATLDAVVLQRWLIDFLIFVASLTVHEWAHAWTAHRLGDDTALRQGRVTFNPVVHIDPIGTIAMPIFNLVLRVMGSNFGMIGWARPVPVDPRNLKHPVRDDLLITLAGPGSNLVLCLLGGLVGGLFLRFAPDARPLVYSFVYINALLAVFNMIPLPPLDGSHVLRHAIGMSAEAYYGLARWSMLILLVLINVPGFVRLLTLGTALVASPFFALVESVRG